MGNHGGSSIGEVSPAMIFASPEFAKIRHTPALENEHLFPPDFVNRIRTELQAKTRVGPTHGFIRQVDLVPSLSCLFGLPIPKNNIGKVIRHLFPTTHAQALALDQNIRQISNLVGRIVSAQDLEAVLEELNHAVTG